MTLSYVNPRTFGGIMQVFADSWLKEARSHISSCRNPSVNADPPGPSDLQKIAEATEKAIKAALIESHGTIPRQYTHHKLVATCQVTGLWDVLPPTLKNFVREVEPYSTVSSNRTPYASGSEKCFSVAPKFIDYIEQHVIGNNSVLKRLNVA
jgi:hypothetical protein